jgi:hypothetical protein
MKGEREVIESPAKAGEEERRRIEQEGDDNSAVLDESALIDRGNVNEDEEAEEKEAAEFSLSDFRNALAAHPTAARFIIIRDEAGNVSLQALEEEATQGKSRSKNMVVTAALRTALALEQPHIDIEDLLPVNPMTSVSSYPSLNAERLQAVFERIDKNQLNSSALTIVSNGKNEKRAITQSTMLGQLWGALPDWNLSKNVLSLVPYRATAKVENKNEFSKKALQKTLIGCQKKAEKAKARGDTKTAKLHDQAARALGSDKRNPGATYAYNQAAKEQEEKNSEIAELWRKVALNYEAQAEAFIKDDTVAVGLHNKATKALGEAVNSYCQAAEEQEKGDIKVAGTWRKVALSYEAQAEALIKGDTAAAELHCQVAKALGIHHDHDEDHISGAAYAYTQATEERKKENHAAAEAYRKMALSYEAQAADLIKGDTVAAELQNQVAEALEEAVNAYNQTVKVQKKRNSEDVEAYLKSALSFEAQAEALVKGDTATAELHNQVAKTLGGDEWDPGAAFAYSRAAEEQEKGNSEIANAWRKAALSYEAQAADLIKGDTAAAKLHYQAAKAFGSTKDNPGAVDAYRQAAKERNCCC